MSVAPNARRDGLREEDSLEAFQKGMLELLN